MDDDPLKPLPGDEPVPDDTFCPPAIPTEVFCLHCQKEYDSYLIEWRVHTYPDGTRHGFWSCPTPNCGGVGFGCDILPTDPEYRDEHGGWFCDDGEEEYDDELDDELVEDLDDLPEEGPPRGDQPPPGDEEIPF